MATAVFVPSGEEELPPCETASADQLSILLQETERLDDEHWRCLVGFLVPELALPHMWPGAALLVLEGPRTVAHVLIETLLGKGDTSRA